MYRDRTTSRINLLHHLAVQNDNEVMKNVSLHMQRDSASMVTLAVVTVVFLPGAFINVRPRRLHQPLVSRVG